MDENYKILINSLQKAKNERRFILDFAFPIKKITHCEMCNAEITGTEPSYIRGWFEVGRQVYGEWSSEGKKGITICPKHERKEYVAFIADFVNDLKLNNTVLKEGEMVWEFRNDIKDQLALDKITQLDVDAFREYMLSNNKRFTQKKIDKRLLIDRSAWEKIVDSFYTCMFCREFQVYDDIKLIEELKSVEESIDISLLNRCQKGRRNEKATIKRISELLSEVAIVRFIYLKEIPKQSALQRKIANYVNTWGGLEMYHIHKENVDKNDKIKMLDSIITKTEENLEIAKKLIQLLRG